MSLKKRIQSQLIERTKARDVVGANTLRLLLAAVKNREVEVRRELEDQEILRIIQSQVKQRKDAIQFYEKGERLDLLDKDKRELALLMSFMPEQLSEEDIVQAVKQVVGELKARDMKDMGRVMKTLMSRLGGSADGKLVSEVVKRQLNA